MSTIIGELLYKITGDNSQLSNSIKDADNKAQQLGKQFLNIGKIVQGAIGTAALIGMKNISLELINAASNAEETRNKFNVVFRDVAEQARASADELRNSYGLSGEASERLLSNTGDLLTGFGFTKSAALDLSTQVNKLAADLGSFNNVSTEAASGALTKALLGETESAKALGIVIKQDSEEFKNGIKAIMATTGATETQAKAQYILSEAYKQSGNAIGDFERSQDSFANQLRIAQAAVDDVKVSLGEELLPIATELIAFFKDNIIPIISDVTAGFKELPTPIKLFTLAIPPLAAALITLQAALGPVGLVIAGIGVAATGAAILIGKFSKSGEQTATAFKSVNDEVSEFNAEVKSMIDRLSKPVEIGIFGNIVDEELATKIADFRKQLDDVDKQLNKNNGALVSWNGSQALSAEETQKLLEKKERLTKALKEIEDAYNKSTKVSVGWTEQQKKAAEQNAKKKEINEELKKQLVDIANRESILGDLYDDDAEKVTAYNDAIEKLITLGVKGNDPMMQGFVNAVLSMTKDEDGNDIAKTTLEKWAYTFEQMSSYANAFANLQSNINQKRLTELQYAQEEELAAIEKSGLSQEEKEAKVAEVTKKYEKERRRLEYEGAMAAWRFQFVGALANMAQAILSTYAQQVGGASAKTAAAAIIGGLSAIQVGAVIAAKPVKPPNLASGGIIMPSSGGVPTVQAENGAPELTLNGGAEGEALMNNFATRVANAGGAAMAKINIFLDGVITKSNIYNLSRNREINFSAQGVI